MDVNLGEVLDLALQIWNHPDVNDGLGKWGKTLLVGALGLAGSWVMSKLGGMALRGGKAVAGHATNAVKHWGDLSDLAKATLEALDDPYAAMADDLRLRTCTADVVFVESARKGIAVESIRTGDESVQGLLSRRERRVVDAKALAVRKRILDARDAERRATLASCLRPDTLEVAEVVPVSRRALRAAR